MLAAKTAKDYPRKLQCATLFSGAALSVFDFSKKEIKYHISQTQNFPPHNDKKLIDGNPNFFSFGEGKKVEIERIHQVLKDLAKGSRTILLKLNAINFKIKGNTELGVVDSRKLILRVATELFEQVLVDLDIKNYPMGISSVVDGGRITYQHGLGKSYFIIREQNRDEPVDQQQKIFSVGHFENYIQDALNMQFRILGLTQASEEDMQSYYNGMINDQEEDWIYNVSIDKMKKDKEVKDDDNVVDDFLTEYRALDSDAKQVSGSPAIVQDANDLFESLEGDEDLDYVSEERGED
jgi:hypothetical protein